MDQTCPQCGAHFVVSRDDLAFYERVSPEFCGRRYTIPPPKMCPDCRFQRRLMFRNDRHFYHCKSAKSGRQLITIYSPDKPYTVYDKDEWWADDWDPRNFGRAIDFSRPFFEQFHALRLQVPRVCLFTSNTENSYYTNHSLNMKNCYLIWGGGDDEDCLYGNYIIFCKDTLDGLSLYRCERCYEGICSEHCYDCVAFHNCRDCMECIGVEECTSCRHCIGCFGLQRKEYCLFNEDIGKAAWEQRKAEITPLTHEKFRLLRERIQALKATSPHRSSHIFSSEHCSGDMIYNSRRCHHCFSITDCEDCAFVAFTPKGVSCYDCTFTAPDGLELSYFAGSSLGGQQMLFTFLAYYCSNTLYSMECHNSHDLFGCASMRRSEYCTLNTQYTKQEYEKAAAKLVGHMIETGEWGEYFPPELVPIAYNESKANDEFPLAKEEVIRRGWAWYEEQDQQSYLGPDVTIPDDIREVDDDICEKILRCEVSGKLYKITPLELAFYRKMNLPIPRRCPEQRHRDRLGQRNPLKLWSRRCAKCGQAIQTNYPPERPEIVYCESCYLKEVY